MNILESQNSTTPISVDADSTTFQEATSRHVDRGIGRVTVLTSKRAIKDYDGHHPERIVCIVFSAFGGRYVVVVNNREFQGHALFLRAVVSREEEEAGTKKHCIICMDSYRVDEFHHCSQCLATTCGKCLALSSSAADKIRCPNCRRWTLHGDAFGTPSDMMPEYFELSSRKFPGDSLVDDVISKLDGKVDVILRTGNAMIVLGPSMSVTRLAGTRRYSHPLGLLRQTLRTFISKEFRKDANAKLHVYIRRDTWRILNEKPVVEVSAFRILKSNNNEKEQRISRVQQLDPDSWRLEILEFGDDDKESTVQVKVAYVEPVAFGVPVHMRSAMADIRTFATGKLATISVTFISQNLTSRTESGEYTGFNFDRRFLDQDEDEANKDNMNTKMMLSLLDMHISDGRDSVLICRAWPNTDDGDSRVNVGAFVFGVGRCVRATPGDCRTLVESDIDGLRGSCDGREVVYY